MAGAGMRDVAAGVGLLAGGFAGWVRRPGLMLLGAVPAAIVGAVYLAGLIVLAANSGGIAEWLTPFADGWDEPWRSTVRVSAALALVGAAILLVVFTFTAVTLAVGDPFYERIWRATEAEEGADVPEPPGGFWHQVRRGLATGLRLLALSIAIGLALFVVGLIPLVGAVAGAVLAAVLGGWVLALELTGFAGDARGLSLRERRGMLGARRARTLGFGVAVYLVFLLPLGAVIAMPAAVAGATRLLRLADREAARTKAGRHPEG